MSQNLLQLFDETCREHASNGAVLVKRQKRWERLTWAELGASVRSLSACLEGRGVVRGDRVAILSNTRVEWTLVDLAILSLGAITVPIYHSNLSEEVLFILKNSGAKGIFVEDNAQLNKVKAIREELPELEFIVLMSRTKAISGVVSLSTCLKTDPHKAAAYQQNIKTLTENDFASLVYTSGTTGEPKGAILTHGNFLAEVDAQREIMPINSSSVSICFLPLAHILGRAIQFHHISCAYTMAYAESIERLGDNIAQIRPNFMVCVPRIFEKIYERILSQVHSSSRSKQKLFSWARQVGEDYSRAKQRREPCPVSVSLQYLLASRLVFGKIRDRLGGRMVFAVCGGAALAKEIAEFFHAAGISILEGYGLTETTAAVNCVRMDRIAFGVVGPPVRGVEEKIADDGEILVRGPVIFKGYYKNEAATREVLEDEGWFHTGDIGEFMPDGSLRITDRKKDIIVTAGGKNIAPQKIESMLKLNKYISQVVVHGDKRKYLTALITLSPDQVKKFVKQRGIHVNGNRIAQNPEIQKMIKSIIDENNKKLPSYETIKRFAILDHELTQEAGEITPSLKIKRRFVVKKYASILDRLYEESSK